MKLLFASLLFSLALMAQEKEVTKGKTKIKEVPYTRESCLWPENVVDCPVAHSHEERHKEEAVEIGLFSQQPNTKDYDYEYSIPKRKDNE